MTSHLPLLLTIDYLIQRIDNVNVLHYHWKLVATYLTTLRHGLSQPDTLEDTRQLQKNIEQTLIVIDEVVASCTEKEVSLNGVSYRDLESLLLRLQIRLAHHEADLTDDYQTKVQILSNAYHEQQILVLKVFDETMKQRLETIEQNNKQKNIEQLRLLHEKYFDTIEVYLRGCIELHKSVPLTGLTANIVAKIAQTFYHVSSEDQIQLEHKWQSYNLPLTRTFIQFKPDRSTSFERNESRRLLMESETDMLQGPHSRKQTSKGIWERLVSAPYMMSMIERDRYEQDEDVSEENIIRSKRWIVVLGDPGSGKTSFARWLVRHLAQTLLLNGQHSTDYGPLRIPILIRIGEFAEMLKEQPSLTLFDYIGKHKWMGKAVIDDLSGVDNLSCALQDYIRHGQALVILDGLDEIPVSDQRSVIINVVENFVDAYVQTPTGASAFDNAYLSRLLDDPSRSGGNQLIVTSRIVGYHAAPLAGQFSHYTIRPMDMEHMKDFVDYWFFRVHQQILDALDLSLLNQGENHAEALKGELEKPENNGLLDVASNSCLLSFICSVAFSQLEGSPLPTQRICLYEAIVNSMLTLWSSKRSTIPIPDLIRILSDIATYIHGTSASGLIHEEKMKEICIQSIKGSLNKNLQSEENIQDIEGQGSEFVRIIRDDVGILAARGESLYGFLHLTFQEYFTCLKLVHIDQLFDRKLATYGFCYENKVQLVAQSLRRHSNNPRFRVPIALALGKISLSWSQKDFNRFCLEFIREQDECGSFLPLGAYMLVSCGNDLVNYPSNDVLFDTLDYLIIAAGQHKWSVVCPFLFDHMTISLRKLRHDVVSLWINNFLSRSPPHAIQTISALCHLLEGEAHKYENIKWLNQSSCLMLQYLSTLDNETNEFAIDRLLVKIAFANHRLLPVDSTTFKGYLLTQEIELNSIPIALFPLIITLYGGLKRNGETVTFDPFHIYRESIVVSPILVRFLSRNSRDMQDETIMLIKQECLRLLLIRIQNQDESPETVDLCIATICLFGIDYVKENIKIISNSLLRICFSRFKYVSMILRQYYFAGESDDVIEKKTTKFISNVIQNKVQYDQASKVQFLLLLNSIRRGLARLRSSTTSVLLEGRSLPDKRVTLNLPNSLRKEYDCLNHLISTDIQLYPDRKSSSLLHHFTKLFWILEHNEEFETQYRMALAMDTLPGYLLLHNDEDLLFPFTFIPLHLQNLYRRLLEQNFIMISSKDVATDDRQHLYFGHILVECLMVISNISCRRLSILAALIALLPCLRMHQLENFGSSLLWALAIKQSNYLNDFETGRQRPMDYETGLYINKVEDIPAENDMADEERRTLIRNCIEQEQQRLRNALIENDVRSMALYAACVSLARVSQWTQEGNRWQLLEESMQGVMLINNKLACLDALCVIAFYSDSEYNQFQVNTHRSLQEEIKHQLHEVYPDLPLLLHSAIFIRCLPLLDDQQMLYKCMQSLFNKFNDAECEDQHVVYEALFPYLQSYAVVPSKLGFLSSTFMNSNMPIRNNSSVMMEYLNIKIDEHLSSSLFISNMYLVELISDFHEWLTPSFYCSVILQYDSYAIHKSIVNILFELESPILTVAQALMVTNILFSVSSRNQSKHSENLCVVLSNALHHFDLVEFKARHLLESWMKWKDSNELSLFAYHAALLLVNSDLWSVEAATIVCDLLCSENDRYRQRAETLLRFESDDDIRTSSKLGINVLLTLAQKRAHYQHTSPSGSLTLLRMFEDTTIDIQSHLEIFLWLERYRVHMFSNTNYSLTKSKLSPISHVFSYFPTNITMDVSFCDNIRQLSNDLMQYMCTLIISNFSSFLEVNGDSTSTEVLESHIQFSVSVLVFLVALMKYTDETRHLAIDALITLMQTSKSDEICQAAAYALGYICNERTYKILFNRLEAALNKQANENVNDSDYCLCSLISSYCHCVSVSDITVDQVDMDLFYKLLQHSSQNVVKSVHAGLGCVLRNSSVLLKMLDSDYIRCYHALVESTAYLLLYTASEKSAIAAADFLEQHPDLLPIFVVELYNSIHHYTEDVLHIRTTNYCLAYGYPQYVEIASLIGVRMPAAFCAFIKDWCDGDKLKRALYYTSKQHKLQQRAGSLSVLSVFGELTVELCEMLIEALRDDPYIQHTCYKCLTRINSIKDEKAVLKLLFTYLKSRSMNVRYAAAKMLLQLSQYSLVPFDQVQTILNDLILDPSSNEDLWLIKEQDKIVMECVYYYAGPLKDVVYSLLVQHLISDSSGISQRNVLSHTDMDFIESEKASRLAACRYEKKIEEDTEVNIPSTTKMID